MIKISFTGACANLGGGGGLALGMPNVVGVFIVTIGGCLFATYALEIFCFIILVDVIFLSPNSI